MFLAFFKLSLVAGTAGHKQLKLNHEILPFSSGPKLLHGHQIKLETHTWKGTVLKLVERWTLPAINVPTVHLPPLPQIYIARNIRSSKSVLPLVHKSH